MLIQLGDDFRPLSWVQAQCLAISTDGPFEFEDLHGKLACEAVRRRVCVKIGQGLTRVEQVSFHVLFVNSLVNVGTLRK